MLIQFLDLVAVDAAENISELGVRLDLVEPRLHHRRFHDCAMRWKVNGNQLVKRKIVFIPIFSA